MFYLHLEDTVDGSDYNHDREMARCFSFTKGMDEGN